MGWKNAAGSRGVDQHRHAERAGRVPHRDRSADRRSSPACRSRADTGRASSGSSATAPSLLALLQLIGLPLARSPARWRAPTPAPPPVRNLRPNGAIVLQNRRNGFGIAAGQVDAASADCTRPSSAAICVSSRPSANPVFPAQPEQVRVDVDDRETSRARPDARPPAACFRLVIHAA